jgi:23S rRNA pseudouridine1911/1915/1917 synthase
VSSPPPPPTPDTLLGWLAARYPAAKRQTLRRMLQDGRVTLNGRPVVRAGERVTPRDRVEVADRPAPRTGEPAEPAARRAPKLDIVFEDDALLVVNKPPGLLTSTTPGERRPTLLARVREYVLASPAPRGRPPRVGLIHRLDRDASGLLVFSKTHDAYLSLKRQFFEHSVERTYTAVVRGAPTPPAGRVQSRLVERADGTVYSARRPGEGERAVTEYEVVERGKGHSLVRVTLHTGRKHQIRVHLSERGAPIIGDTMYGKTAQPPGGRKQPAEERLMLAATRLSFTHPRTGERLTFERAAPPEFAAALAGPAATSR